MRKGHKGLTEKQAIILDWIDRLGVAQVGQLVKVSKIRAITIYKTVDRLKEYGFVEDSGKIKPKFYWITKAGSEYNGKINMAYRKKISNYALLRHTILVNDLIYYFMKNYEAEGTEYSLETERELMVKKRFEMVMTGSQAKRTLVPDFVITTNGHRYPIEVELTQKSGTRVDHKMEMYKAELAAGIDEMVYYFSDERLIRELIQAFINYKGLQNEVEVYDLDQVLGDDQSI
ncbi:hypothetical protein LG045_09730 (plasmid) [Limosilactobacillus gastricus]|uniref:Replication-relaxation n=1 Tax=Limosilactobacillus gastricus DSM 16045 TaxID=1423749 RepID=A0A0R1VF20_9LACO|nr:replication-relaxation family protein [Limosilactobacillus gastricus]KRM00460.1 hypothetical protein FC60_GL001208 [Limosilactobacillus gastricus DSM 16045]QGF41353.1 hypothetical protein LG045_09730 [Limosilactobacillus gastricus]